MAEEKRKRGRPRKNSEEVCKPNPLPLENSEGIKAENGGEQIGKTR